MVDRVAPAYQATKHPASPYAPISQRQGYQDQRRHKEREPTPTDIVELHAEVAEVAPEPEDLSLTPDTHPHIDLAT